MRLPGPLRAAARRARRGLEVVLVERRYDLPPVEAAPPAREHHKAYAPSPWRLLGRLLPAGDAGAHDVFLDLGCGAGRVLLEAAERHPFRRVIGVELEPSLAAAARELLERNVPERRWEVVTADASEYEVPDDVTVAYLFDPFTGPVFDAVIARLEASVGRRPRRVRILYVVPVELDRLRGRVTPVRRGSAGWLRTGGRYEYLVADLMPPA